VGAIGLAFAGERALPDEERAFALDLGRQAAQALERARLYEAERTARTRTERLQALTAALGAARTLDDVARVALEEGARAIGLTHGSFSVLDPGGATFTIVRELGHAREHLDVWRTFPNAPGLPAHDAVLARAPLVLGRRAEYLGRYPALAEWSLAVGHHGQALFPLMGTPPSDAAPGPGGAAPVLGLLAFDFREDRDVPAAEARFFASLAAVTAQALERVLLAEAERGARARAEDAQREAEAANRAKGEFLANMSHELRTPLNAIGGYAQLMELGLHGPVTEEQRTALRRVQAAGRHLLGLINDVLNYAKIESGSVQYALAAVDLREVLAATTPLVEPQRLAKGLAFATRPPDAECLVWADRDKLVQVLLNLLSNAVKFTPAGGRVSLDVRVDGDMAVLTVADTGIGIPADRLDAVFAPFVQVDSRRARAYEGTGLGLTISRDLARGMGGDLTVTSEEGRGSTFALALRRADGDAGSPTERRFRAERRRRRRDMRRDPPRDEPDRRSGEDRRGGE
jgi:signal transduction histidine kinase